MISCALVEIFLNFHFKQLTFPGLHEIVSDPDPPLGTKLSIRQLEFTLVMCKKNNTKIDLVQFSSALRWYVEPSFMQVW